MLCLVSDNLLKSHGCCDTKNGGEERALKLTRSDVVTGPVFGISPGPSLVVALISNRDGGIQSIHVYPPHPPPPLLQDSLAVLILIVQTAIDEQKFPMFRICTICRALYPYSFNSNDTRFSLIRDLNAWALISWHVGSNRDSAARSRPALNPYQMQ